MRDKYASESDNLELKQKWNREWLKQFWKLQKQFFGMLAMKSILNVEFQWQGVKIRATTQF